MSHAFVHYLSLGERRNYIHNLLFLKGFQTAFIDAGIILQVKIRNLQNILIHIVLQRKQQTINNYRFQFAKLKSFLHYL